MKNQDIEVRLKSRGVRVEVTRPREYELRTGERQVVIDRVQIKDGEDFDLVVRAISRFIKDLTVLRSTSITRQGRRRYVAQDIPAKPSDIYAALLVRHEMRGSLKGDSTETPWISTVTGDGRKYTITLKGKPVKTCQFCGRHAEPLHLGRKTKKHFHQLCYQGAQAEASRAAARALSSRVEV